ncbi:MAG TPA: DUF1592 domain-containing protein [Blastocatellia bacterium]|nr:DUF1592 domain-containing protein [Blastocatellia bacterium]HMV81668.1 DUF1592 domain-containing protein [Blastocatellia bacterium]HMZ18892.1 DUF1592 domain-containing protein [Blastocatellia bacterium]HNG29626.1 DUF1592 domain-containing protein [Blastocatellia bacterium]
MKRKNSWRLLIVLLPLLWFVVSPATQQAQKPGGFEKSIQPFLAENCYACHNAKRASGELNLELYKTAAAIAEHREQWETVLLKLKTGEMPPKGFPRPDENQLKAVIGWIEAEFARMDRAVKPDPGRVTARRLNRAEYNNTVRDLLGVDFNPADDFPQDDSGYGFDNIGDVLSLSPVLMEKYLTAAEKIARTAVFGTEQVKPTLARFRPENRRVVPSPKPLTEYDETGLSLPNSLHVTHHFPVASEYNFRLFLNGNRPSASEPLSLAVWIDGQLVKTMSFDPEYLASFEADRQALGGQVAEIRAQAPAGEHLVSATLQKLYEGLPPRYNGPNPSKRTPPPAPEFKPRADLPPERVAAAKKRFEEARAVSQNIPANDARVSSLEIGGPYNQAKGPAAESLKKVFVCGQPGTKITPDCERKIVASLARRAYRRPVTPEEIGKLTGLIAMAQRQGDSFEEGLVQAIQAMLVSPHFLFRIEQDRKTASTDGYYQLNSYELASRLSYFLWSSMPDDELFQLAGQDALRKPEVLSAQVQRMLKNDKAKALVENFGGQWLELRKLEAVKPDRQKFAEFDEYLNRSMRQETELFFAAIVREDRSILDFIDGNYSFLNERLAKFYKIPGVSGPEFRKVTLAPETQRGGILTQASVLTVSSYSTRTSPVLRGKWILENVLNAPPPAPPPGVPTLDDAKIGTAASLRQQLEQHRTNPTCAACHSRMDPLGFGLENFNAIGAWRTKDGNFPVDSAGVLPDGRTFSGPNELKAIVKADSLAFAECLTEKLMTYALGRGLERYDKPTVKRIAKQVAAKDYRFSTLALEIAGSLPFQNRRGERAQ